MNQTECRDTRDRLLAACLWMTALPLDEFLKAIDRAESAGLVLDPTLYRAAQAGRMAGDGLLAIRALAGGAQGLVRVLASDPALCEMAKEAAVRVASAETNDTEGGAP